MVIGIPCTKWRENNSGIGDSVTVRMVVKALVEVVQEDKWQLATRGAVWVSVSKKLKIFNFFGQCHSLKCEQFYMEISK